MSGPGRLKRMTGHGILILLSFVYVLPFAWLVTTSLQPDQERSHVPPAFVPTPRDSQARSINDAVGPHVAYPATARHYAKAVTRVPVHLFFRNTLLICVLVVFGTILSNSLVAYGFSILRWRGRNVVFFLLLTTMMLPGQVTMVPIFLIWRKLGLINTFAPLVVPAFLAAPFFVFLFRQFFLTIPRDLIDAARIDGAGELRIWAQIVLPLSVPVVAVVALFSFLTAWNDFLGPLIYLADQGKYTLSLGLAMFRTQYGSEYGQMMAVATLMVVPIIVLFFFAQKTFIQGIKTTGMKA